MVRCSQPLSMSFAVHRIFAESSPSPHFGQKKLPPDGFWVNLQQLMNIQNIVYKKKNLSILPPKAKNKNHIKDAFLEIFNWFTSADLFLLKSSIFSFQGYTFKAANGYVFGHAELLVCVQRRISWAPCC